MPFPFGPKQDADGPGYLQPTETCDSPADRFIDAYRIESFGQSCFQNRSLAQVQLTGKECWDRRGEGSNIQEACPLKLGDAESGSAPGFDLIRDFLRDDDLLIKAQQQVEASL